MKSDRHWNNQLYHSCCLCNKNYCVSNYPTIDINISRIMDSMNLCFECAYWEWRLGIEDSRLSGIHNNDIIFKKKALEEIGVDPNKITWADMAIGGFHIPANYSAESLEKARQNYCEYLLQYYQNRWHFGKPLIIKEEHNGLIRLHHYVLYPDNNLFTYFEVGEGLDKGAILMNDGMVSIPNIGNKISSQGPIPKRIVDKRVYDHDGIVSPKPKIESNAVWLSYVELLGIYYQIQTLHLNEPGAVPQKILEKYFINLHN